MKDRFFTEDDDFFSNDDALQEIEKHFLQAVANKYQITNFKVCLGETRYGDGDTDEWFYCNYSVVAIENHFVVISKEKTQNGSAESFEIFTAPFDAYKKPILHCDLLAFYKKPSENLNWDFAYYQKNDLTPFVDFAQKTNKATGENADWQSIVSSFLFSENEKAEQERKRTEERNAYLENICLQILSSFTKRYELVRSELIAEINHAKLWGNQKKKALKRIGYELERSKELKDYLFELANSFEAKMFGTQSDLQSSLHEFVFRKKEFNAYNYL